MRLELAPCPVCDAADPALVADRSALLSELELLWETAADRPARPPSRLADTLSFTHPPPLAVVRCRACAVLYRNPRERAVQELYAGEEVDVARLGELGAAQYPAFARLVRRLTGLNGGPGHGLELGSYAGAFLQAAAAGGWRFRGTDVNPRTVAFLRASGCDVCLGGIAECAPDRALDVVACWNTFEQLPDPRSALRTARERLRPAGILALRVPNGGFYLALHRHLRGALRAPARALLARHNFLGFPYRVGFTPGSLARLLRDAGFEPVGCHSAPVLAADADGRGAGRRATLLERGFRPLTGAPWLEVFARRI